MNEYFQSSAIFTATGVGSADVTYGYFIADANLPGPDLAGCNWIEVQLSGAAPSVTNNTPVMDVLIESSMDGTNYDTLITFTQVNTVAFRERKSVLRTASVQLGRYLRVKMSVGTASTSTTYMPTVYILAGGNG